MTETLRDWADKCEARAIDALDLEGTTADAAQLLEVAMLLDQRADYIEARGQAELGELAAAEVKRLLGIIERTDDACREAIESATFEGPVSVFADELREILRVPL